jgi:hypothetical protein
MVEDSELQQFASAFPDRTLPELVRKAFEFVDEEGPFVARGFGMPAHVQKKLVERVGEAKARQLVAFGWDSSNSLYAFWLYPNRTLADAPVVYLDSANAAHGVISGSFEELLLLLAVGHKDVGRVTDWTPPAEAPTYDLKTFRTWFETDLGLAAPADPAALIARARATHPDFRGWLVAQAPVSVEAASPTPSATPCAIATPGTMKLPELASALRPGEELPMELVKLFEFAAALGVFFAGNFEVDEDQREAVLAWFQGDARAAGEFLMFGHDGTGSLYGFWRHDGLPVQRAPVVFLDSEGARCRVLADDMKAFLGILALGKRDVGWTAEENGAFDVDDELRTFRAWLSRELHVVPAADPKVTIAQAAARHPSLDAWIDAWIAARGEG